jgi:hypothetical protein
MDLLLLFDLKENCPNPPLCVSALSQPFHSVNELFIKDSTYRLNDALNNQVAKYAEEHESFMYVTRWKMLYFLIQHPFTIIILGCSLIWIFGRVE